MNMTKIIDWVLGRDKKSTHNTSHDMTDVMRRVDQQIGRAVERLSDR